MRDHVQLAHIGPSAISEVLSDVLNYALNSIARMILVEEDHMVLSFVA